MIMMSRGWLLRLPLVLLAVFSALSSSSARAQSPSADPQPQVVYQSPRDGDVLQQPAFVIQLCLASPLNIQDLDAGGDFTFSITEPDGIGLGHQDVFQPNGYGITVYPGNPVGEIAGQWKFHFRVTSPDAQSPLEGDINYTVDPDGDPVPQKTPPVCVESGGLATPAPGEARPGTDGDSSNVLNYALIAIGAVGVALGALILFFLSRRRSHRPAPVPSPAAPMASGAADTRRTSSPVSESGPPLPKWSGPLSPAPPLVVGSDTPVPKPSPPPTPAIPPFVVQSEPPVPEPSPPPTPAVPPFVVSSEPPLPEPTTPPTPATPEPVAQSETLLPKPTPPPEPSRPPVSATPAADSGFAERAGERPDSSRFALIAIGAAVILVLGLILRGRGKRGDSGRRD
jgi:hypothetical protein